MRLLSPASKDGYRWWCWWLQERRRARLAGASSSLLAGLVQFYQPAPGLKFFRSWNESASVPGNPYEGLVTPTGDAGSGSYASGDVLWYQLWAHREEVGQRVYAGVAYQKEATASAPASGFLWPAWTATPTWVTGYALLRWVNGTYSGYRTVTLATMLAGWLDSGSGWSGGLPHDFANPPVTAKVIWNVVDEYALPETVSVVASPLGGWAFDSTLGDHLARAMGDDLRRCPDVTMAYWVCAADGTSGVLAVLRGIFDVGMGGDYWCAEPNLSFGTSAPVNLTDHQDGDWYLTRQGLRPARGRS